MNVAKKTVKEKKGMKTKKNQNHSVGSQWIPGPELTEWKPKGF